MYKFEKAFGVTLTYFEHCAEKVGLAVISRLEDEFSKDGGETAHCKVCVHDLNYNNTGGKQRFLASVFYPESESGVTYFYNIEYYPFEQNDKRGMRIVNIQTVEGWTLDELKRRLLQKISTEHIKIH